MYMYILGIETSCDETAASVVKFNTAGPVTVLSSIISSQIEIHQKYGGVVPEIAAREHVLNILPVINEALKVAKVSHKQLTAIGITKGPGLITSLIAGIETARTLSYIWKKPLIEVNHIAGHIYANFIDQKEDIKFPSVILTVSGGHTTILKMSQSGNIKILGETRDDAAGEAYDKAAKMMDLGYPGGPIISQRAALYKKGASDHKIELPRPMINSSNLDFSFSGLKTALLYQLKQDKSWKRHINQYCYEFQQAIIETLIAKTIKAGKIVKAKTIMLTGGVSANTQLREQMSDAVKKKLPETTFLVPDKKYTTDNAAMIATAAVYLYRQGKTTNFRRLRVDASLQLK